MTSYSGSNQPPDEATARAYTTLFLHQCAILREWVSTHLTFHKDASILMVDILQAWYPEHGVGAIQMNLFNWQPFQSLLTHVLPGAFVHAQDPVTTTLALPTVVNVRWKRLENCNFSAAISTPEFKAMDVHIEQHAQAFLYMKQPYRTRAWLWLYFLPVPSTSLALNGVYKLYVDSFRYASDTYKILKKRAFAECLLALFEGTELVRVTPHHSVITGLMLCPVERSIDKVLKQMRQAMFDQMVVAGKIEDTPPKNVFAQALWNDPQGPLLILPRGIPGPLSDRLRRRGNYPHGPLWYEEPGFPGIKLKYGQGKAKSLKKVREVALKMEGTKKLANPPVQNTFDLPWSPLTAEEWETAINDYHFYESEAKAAAQQHNQGEDRGAGCSLLETELEAEMASLLVTGSSDGKKKKKKKKRSKQKAPAESPRMEWSSLEEID